MAEEDTAQPPPPSLWQHADQSTEKVAARLKTEIDKWPLIHFLMDLFGGLIYGAAQKLLDREKKTGEHRARDSALIDSCPRLFTDCYAGYLLIRRGLILQAAVQLRSAFEVTTQAILFLEREDMAEKWLKGGKIRPKEVRELTSMPETERALYQKLSDMTHPNYDAFKFFSAPVPGPGMLGKASFYGGWYAPKQAGQIAIQFLWAQLVFLEKFYEVYNEDMSQQGLLWRPETMEMFGDNGPREFTWQEFLRGWRQVLTKLTAEHDQQTPNDIVDIALALSTYSPEEKDQWRKAFEEIEAKSKAAVDPTSKRRPDKERHPTKPLS